ncbi:MAG: flagellar biosynthesis anti-sigma factor FlgM [Lachnospiraceae bacterium]|mgnify:FL=1|jgi:anti-sigma28 factor (negative regulator of flagellin synthesis)|nr:flagellar biosynthesis anti-sigma factor FlgM [Lachnospiraceae bacterium]
MNVLFRPVNNATYRAPVSAPRKRASQPAAMVKGDYDTVNIQRSRTVQDDDETFARMLARKTASQLTGNSVSPDRLQELGRKVADGSYHPDSQQIAGRMLGLS